MKANKAVQKLLDDALSVAIKGSRLTSSVEELTTLHGKLKSSLGDLGFLLKFKKTKDGQPLNSGTARAFLAMAAKMLQDIIDVTKLCRTLMPKKEK